MTIPHPDIIALLQRIVDRLTIDGGHPIYPGSLAHKEIETMLERVREGASQGTDAEGTCQQ